MVSSPEIVRFLVSSDNRVTTLESLTTGASDTRSGLQTETGIPRSTLSRILDEFENRDLVTRDGYRYDVTPFGGYLESRLESIFDSIEVMQRLLMLLKQLTDTHSDHIFTTHMRSEILTSTSSDPGAPARRFGDRLEAAAHVSLLVPAAIPVLFDVDSVIGDRTQTVDVVIPRGVLEGEREPPTSSQRLRDGIAAGAITVFAHDGAIDHFAGTVDEFAVVGLTDDAGTVLGYIETSDESVHSCIEAIVIESQRDAVLLPNYHHLFDQAG